MPRKPKDRHRFSHQGKLTWLILGAVGPALLIVMLMLWMGDYSAKVQWTLTILILTFAASFISAARDHVIHPLQTMSNLLAALREGDYSIRARGARGDDALGEVLLEVNTLGETLRVQRLGAFEATALLRTIMAEIDVAVFTFDPDHRLRLVNRAGEDLFGQPIDKLLGRTAKDLGLDAAFDVDEDEPLTLSFPGGSGRWGVRRSTFRERGLPHELLVLTDLSRTLREEERRAWQRIVRVLGHEMNNSLAPIKSLAGSLENLLRRKPMPRDWHEDAESGLKSIAARADSLSRFMQAYTRLAKLPPPQMEDVDLGELVQRVVNLEPRLKVQVVSGSKMQIHADAAQIEQVLINLVHNAVDAALETKGAVTIRWREAGDCAEVIVTDEGEGIMNPTNLFVPFFTTKPEGSGIGLTLSQQIAEAHNGTLSLSNRKDRTGAEAVLRLPK
ncbi:MAG TPA: ATP-binding protein [Chthoniobacterales bacterium]|jgi:Signal transduction histidine kinase involved in nitrogen fixation and metabolism regulation|nr:ATP-binding protein [Chthoniobacterales bacterium]